MIAALVTVAVVVAALGSSPAEADPGLCWWRRRRAARAVARTLPELLEALARALRAGVSAQIALRSTADGLGGPLAGDVAEMSRRLDQGQPFDGVLGAWAAARADVPGVRLAAVAMIMAAEAGGSVAQAIDGVADTLREDLGLQAEVQALAAQARASALVIAALPLVFLLVVGATDPAALAFLVTSSLGRTCLALGVGLQGIGFWWMQRIVQAIA